MSENTSSANDSLVILWYIMNWVSVSAGPAPDDPSGCGYMNVFHNVDTSFAVIPSSSHMSNVRSRTLRSPLPPPPLLPVQPIVETRRAEKGISGCRTVDGRKLCSRRGGAGGIVAVAVSDEKGSAKK